MTKEQEFRKQTEEAKFEAFSLMCKKVADLEKENEELKEINEKLRYDFGEGYIQDEKEFWEKTSYLEEQLTKAKEIIKDLLGSENTSCEEEMFFEIRQKAEQFLKDSEVKK